MAHAQQVENEQEAADYFQSQDFFLNPNVRPPATLLALTAPAPVHRYQTGWADTANGVSHMGGVRWFMGHQILSMCRQLGPRIPLHTAYVTRTATTNKKVAHIQTITAGASMKDAMTISGAIQYISKPVVFLVLSPVGIGYGLANPLHHVTLIYVGSHSVVVLEPYDYADPADRPKRRILIKPALVKDFVGKLREWSGGRKLEMAFGEAGPNNCVASLLQLVHSIELLAGGNVDRFLEQLPAQRKHSINP